MRSIFHWGVFHWGAAPWNLYPVRNADTNGHIELAYFNSLKPDLTIPLGLDPLGLSFLMPFQTGVVRASPIFAGLQIFDMLTVSPYVNNTQVTFHAHLQGLCFTCSGSCQAPPLSLDRVVSDNL